MLEHPQGRRASLNPEVSAVAFGPLIDEEQKVRGAIVATYAVMNTQQRGNLETRALARLNKLRADKGLPAATLRPFAGNDEAVAALAKGSQASDVMERMLEQSTQATHQTAQGVRIETQNIDAFDVHEMLLKNTPMEVSLAVGTSQPPNEPWMHYVLLWVINTPGTGQMASVFNAEQLLAHRP